MDAVQVIRERGVAVVVPGVTRLDAAQAPAFKQAAVALIEGGEKRLAIDLSGVDFLDSSGLGAMVSILKALGGQGAVVVCGAKGRVEQLFKLTRMDKVFAVLPDRAQAIDRLAG